MTRNRFRHTSLAAALAAALLLICSTMATGQTDKHQSDRDKITGAYFEEWSIYGANYNVADIQNSGAADVLTHVF